jgi:predicted Mrr-cat superfamily restriction endonuclease
MQNSWMIRAGNNGMYVNDFLISRIIGIECKFVEIVEKKLSIEEIYKLYTIAEPIMKARNKVTQINRFVNLVKIGDIVLCYLAKKRIYYIGIVESDVFWKPDLFPPLSCYRQVKWENEISRDDIKSRRLASLGVPMTIFGVNPEINKIILENARPINR